MKTRSEAKKADRSTATPKKTPKASKIRTPKSEKRKKKDSETPLRIDDLLSSQHFGSQIDVGWDCNSPDALRNIQRYRGEHDTEISDIVMRLLDEEPPENSQSPDNLTRISPPPFGFLRGPTESVRPTRKLRPRKKSGDESSLQDTLYESLRNALHKCESIPEAEEHSSSNKVQLPIARACPSTGEEPNDQGYEADDDFTEEQPEEDKNLLNFSKDLFESTKIKDSENEVFDDTVVDDKVDAENQLDQSDASWSNDELFDESFVIKATQFPETLRPFNSPLIGLKRKQSEDEVSSKPKSPRYTFQLHPKADINSNKLNNNLSKVRAPVAKTVSGVIGKPPVGLLRCASSDSATNSKLASDLPNNTKSNSIKAKPNCGSSFTDRLNCQPMPVSSSYAGTMKHKTGSVGCSLTNNQSKFADSRQLIKSEYVSVTQNSNLAASKSLSSRSIVRSSTEVSLPSQTGLVSISRNSSFRKHNSFNGQESSKSGSTTLTRQRSFSGANSNSNTTSTSSATNLATVPVSNTKFSAHINVTSVSASKSGLNSLKTSTMTSFYSKSKPGATVIPIACTKPSTVNSARNTKPLYSNGTRTDDACLNASKTSKLGSTASNHTVKISGCSAFKGQSVLTRCATMSANSVLVSNAGSLASTVSSSSTLVRNHSKTDSSSSLARVRQPESLEDHFEESPVFGAKKRLSSGAFDTSLTDELLYKLAEPDDLFESQVCDTTIKPDVKQTSSNFAVSGSSHIIPSVSRTSNVLTVSKPVTKTTTMTTQKQTLGGSKVNPVTSSVVPSKNEKRTFSFKTSQKPTVNVRQGDLKSAGDKRMEGQQSSAVFRKPVKSPEKPATMTKAPAPAVDHNIYSEDLFGSDDDDFMEDDGLTEPEILAMLDEVEFLATQQMKTSEELKTKDTHTNRNDHDQLSPPCTPPKYFQSDIEKKKQEALKRREMSSHRLYNSQESKPNLDTHYSPERCEPLSQDKPLTPIKCSPVDIEKKRQEALKRRQNNKIAQQLNFSQESKTSACASNILGQSPSKCLPLSQGQSSSQSSSDKDFDNSQGYISSPTKYSPAEIERKRQEAKKRRELSFSQESKVVQATSPCKDFISSQGQTSSQRSNEGANSTQIQSSPIKYSQVEIERKKQEALKRRKLKLTGVQRK